MGQASNTASSGWLAPLDGLRGISILMVLTAHVYSRDWPELGGHHGVTVFFVLSGFLITRLLLQEQQRAGKINFKAFFIRRSFRLFPIYYVVLATYCILILGTGLRADGKGGFLAALPWYIL